jgi:hypothetical protein
MIFLAGCGPTQLSSTPVARAPQFVLIQQVGIFSAYGLESDRQAAEDVARALPAHQSRISRVLEHDYQHLVTVELFPDQDSFDRYGMNPQMQGYYAYSGGQRIQMVSPRNPIPQMDIGYEDRVLIAVHEFAHLVNNAINSDLPLWLDEGVAIYAGPHDLYAYVCQHNFPFAHLPTLTEMEASYSSVPAADLFAYALVDFIATEYGQAKLNRLLRAPDSFEELLGLTRWEFQQHWRQYMNQHYANQ